MKMAFVAGLVVTIGSTCVYAQQDLVGKYTGTYPQSTPRGEVSLGLTLEILAVEGDTVKGKAVRIAAGQAGRACAGAYPVEGTLKGDALELKATEKGATGDCGMVLKLMVEGTKLVGTIGNARTQLSR